MRLGEAGQRRGDAGTTLGWGDAALISPGDAGLIGSAPNLSEYLELLIPFPIFLEQTLGG